MVILIFKRFSRENIESPAPPSTAGSHWNSGRSKLWRSISDTLAPAKGVRSHITLLPSHGALDAGKLSIHILGKG